MAPNCGGSPGSRFRPELVGENWTVGPVETFRHKDIGLLSALALPAWSARCRLSGEGPAPLNGSFGARSGPIVYARATLSNRSSGQTPSEPLACAYQGSPPNPADGCPWHIFDLFLFA